MSHMLQVVLARMAIGFAAVVNLFVLVMVASSALFAPLGVHSLGSLLSIGLCGFLLRRYFPLQVLTSIPLPTEWTPRCSWWALLGISYFWIGTSPREPISAEMAASLAIAGPVLLVPFALLMELVIHFQREIFVP